MLQVWSSGQRVKSEVFGPRVHMAVLLTREITSGLRFSVSQAGSIQTCRCRQALPGSKPKPWDRYHEGPEVPFVRVPCCLAAFMVAMSKSKANSYVRDVAVCLETGTGFE